MDVLLIGPSKRPAFGRFLSGSLIQRQVESQNIDTRLAQQPQRPALGVVGDEPADGVRGQAASLGHS